MSKNHKTFIIKDVSGVSNVTPKQIQDILNSIDVRDMFEFVENLYNEKWVPSCYWEITDKERIPMNRFHGEMYWAMYSYLVSRKIVMFEDPYYKQNSSITERYKLRTSYDNAWEEVLYQPMLDLMVPDYYEVISRCKTYRSDYYTISRKIKRNYIIKGLLDD